MNRRFSPTTIGLTSPQSFVTKGKQRLKQHIDTVYLNNGDEFEVELYNPTQNKVLAKIEMNGNSIGSGIIIRPGERVFLERYMDEAKKFLFETYTVNGNNQEVQDEIIKNGDVVIKFYKESFPTNILNIPFGTNTNLTTNTTIGKYNYQSTTAWNSTNEFTFINYKTTNECGIKSLGELKTREIETGRVEKGSNSNQSFVYGNSDFISQPFKTNWWKIKPISEKVLVKEDLKVFCTECGSKRKKDSYQYCPNCGTKF